MGGSEGLAPIIVHSLQPATTVQNELNMLKDQEGLLSAVNCSVRPRNHGTMPSGMATAASISGSTQPLLHNSVAPCSSGAVICKPTEKENSPLLFYFGFFSPRPTSVPISCAVPQADKAGNLRRQRALINPWQRVK